MHDKANKVKRISQGLVKALLLWLMMKYDRQMLIAAEQIKKNGECIVEGELGDTAAISLSGGEYEHT